MKSGNCTTNHKIMPAKQIVLATQNQGKVQEFQPYFTNNLSALSAYKLIPQSEFTQASVAETGLSFIENALIKARFAAQKSQLPALADDSGLCVTALGGTPGIYSARYAVSDQLAVDQQSQRNIDKLLDKLKHLPKNKRQASFHCVLAFVRDAKDPLPLVVQGHWHGSILMQQQGKGGFGYDPVFQPEGYSCSAAELRPAEKHAMSHRARAMEAFMQAFIAEYKTHV